MRNLFTVILAAGRGKRMKSDLPKVLHAVGGRPMVTFSLEIARSLRSFKTVLVVPKEHDAIDAAVRLFFPETLFAVQEAPRGTGDAVRCALQKSKLGKRGTLLVLNGDMPLISKETARRLVSEHNRVGAAMTILSADHPGLKSYGRIIRDASGSPIGIVEAKDASREQSRISEVNVGVYAFDLEFLTRAISELSTDNKQGEYYLTDMLGIAARGGRRVHAVILDDVTESRGANSRVELNDVNDLYYSRRCRELAAFGTALLGNDVFVDADARVAATATLQAPCFVRGVSVIEDGVFVETGCVVANTRIRKNAHLKASCYLDGAEVGPDCHVGPFAHLRPGTILKKGAKVGNFVEIKKSVVGEGSKASHLSYLGDATIGKHVNIGAGTITCNYDGVNKFKTVLADGVFIGSDTQLVAPVKVGKGAFVGAGTTVTKDVSPYSLAVSRVPQREIPGWAQRRIKKTK